MKDLNKKILDDLAPVGAEALRWRVMLGEVRDLKAKIDKLTMLLEALPCVCAKWRKGDEDPTVAPRKTD